jgi:hypothetical protein
MVETTSLTPDHVLHKITVAYMAGFKRCHEAYLKRNGTQRGKVQLTFGVDEFGRTVDPEAAGFDRELDECLVAQMHNWRFDIPLDPNGKPTRANFQLTLVL